MRLIYQGFALRWMNGWAFGPDDLRHTSARNKITSVGSAEQGYKFHQIRQPARSVPDTFDPGKLFLTMSLTLLLGILFVFVVNCLL